MSLPAALPTDWPAVVSYGILAAFLAWMGWWQNRRARHVAEVAEEVREQVGNDHSTNLRDDLDRVLASIDTQAEHHRELLEALSGMRVTLGHIDLRTARIGTEVIQDRKDFDLFRSDAYAQLRRLKGVASKHHPEEG